MSDDEEGEYNTITHTETGRGVKLLYSKSKVSLHPLLLHIRHMSRPRTRKADPWEHRFTSTQRLPLKTIFPAS